MCLALLISPLATDSFWTFHIGLLEFVRARLGRLKLRNPRINFGILQAKIGRLPGDVKIPDNLLVACGWAASRQVRLFLLWIADAPERFDCGTRRRAFCAGH